MRPDSREVSSPLVQSDIFRKKKMQLDFAYVTGRNDSDKFVKKKNKKNSDTYAHERKTRER